MESVTTEKKKILIIEDELSMRNSLVGKFEKEGFRVFVARNGNEGLEQFRKEHPDLILLDIIMAEMDGLTMLKKLRAESSHGAQVPVILLTNLSPDNEEVNSIITNTAPAYYLVKTDWKMKDVVDKVRSMLEANPS